MTVPWSVDRGKTRRAALQAPKARGLYQSAPAL